MAVRITHQAWPSQGRVSNLHGTGPVVTMSYINQKERLTGMNAAPIDPRSICNLMLDEAGDDMPLSNLALQKLLYFAHGLYLSETGQPLVTGYFEAWQYGPVHPAAYAAFKMAGNRHITFRAERQNPLTGTKAPINPPTEKKVIGCVRKVIMNCAGMTPGQLVDLSHAKDGPWDQIVKKAQSGAALGLRIPNDIISGCFRYHKVFVGLVPTRGEPVEDAPLTARTRFG